MIYEPLIPNTNSSHVLNSNLIGDNDYFNSIAEYIKNVFVGFTSFILSYDLQYAIEFSNKKVFLTDLPTVIPVTFTESYFDRID